MALTPRIALTAATLAACAAERIEPTISASINDGSSSSTESTSLVLTQGGTSGATSPTDLPPTTAATSGTSPLGEPCDVYTQACGPGLKCQPDESVECPSHEGFCADVPLPKSSLAQACIMSGKLCDQHDNCDTGLYCAFAAWLGTGYESRGTCMAYCPGECQSSDQECYRISGTVNVCVERCAPFGPPCSAGVLCVYQDYTAGMICSAPGPSLATAQMPCMYHTDCQSGACAPQGASPCDGSCCTQYCDITDPTACLLIPGTSCNPLPLEEPRPEWEHLGMCVKSM